MKKTVSIIIFLLVAICNIFAFLPGESESKGFMIQGGYAEFATLQIVPLSAQSLEYKQGMPFDLTKSDVHMVNHTDEGRRIATWQLLTNSPYYKLRIICEPMRHTEASKHTDAADPEYALYNTELNYKLTFKYRLSFLSGNENINTNQVSFFVYSDDSLGFDTTERNPIKNFAIPISENSLVGSRDGEIWFVLEKNSVALIMDDKKTAPGYYTAKVTMEMITK